MTERSRLPVALVLIAAAAVSTGCGLETILYLDAPTQGSAADSAEQLVVRHAPRTADADIFAGYQFFYRVYVGSRADDGSATVDSAALLTIDRDAIVALGTDYRAWSQELEALGYRSVSVSWGDVDAQQSGSEPVVQLPAQPAAPIDIIIDLTEAVADRGDAVIRVSSSSASYEGTLLRADQASFSRGALSVTSPDVHWSGEGTPDLQDLRVAFYTFAFGRDATAGFPANRIESPLLELGDVVY